MSGDGFQLGGLFVIAPPAPGGNGGGRVMLDKRQAFYGDDADPADVLAAVRAAVGGGDGVKVVPLPARRAAPVDCGEDVCAT